MYIFSTVVFCLILGLLGMTERVSADLLRKATQPAELILTNQAGGPIELWWIDQDALDRGEDAELISMGPPIESGKDVGLNTFNDHKFVARFANYDASKGVNTQPEARFAKGPMNERMTIMYDSENKEMFVHTPQRNLRYSSCVALLGKSPGALYDVAYCT